MFLVRPRRAVVAALSALALLGGGFWWLRRADPLRMTGTMVIEDVVADLSSTIAPGSVVQQRPDDPVRVASLTPSTAFLDAAGGQRPALLAPPPARVRFRVRVPAGSVLRFASGVQRLEPPDPAAHGVRFSVAVDGEEWFTRDVDPSRKRQRRWFDEQIALGGVERDVEITLATTGSRPGGTPGWNHVRIVSETRRERQRASARAPSVLVILVDALRADVVGCYGAVPSPSPVLDRVAAGGIVYEAAVSQAPWTAPAVATLFTGLHPRSHGVVGSWNDEAPEGAKRGSGAIFLADAHRTLAEEAARAGITTVGVSSNPLVSQGTNFTQGFEHFVEFGWDSKRSNWVSGAAVTDAFLDWVGRNRDLRFFAYLHYMEPHDPYTPPDPPPPPPGLRPAVVAGHAHELRTALQKGDPGLTPAEVGYLRALYTGEVRSWDAELGRLVGALERLGLRESTVLVVLGDHGEEFQEHGLLVHRHQLYDELLRIPLVIAGPGVGRGRIPEQVQGIDLFPTLAGLLDVVPPPGLPGTNLLAAPGMRPAFAETEYGIRPDGRPTEIVAVRAPPWKLIWTPALDRWQLYDLIHDPGEHDDRSAGSPEARVLAEQLVAWRRGAPLPPRTNGADPSLAQKLRALGYAQ